MIVELDIYEDNGSLNNFFGVVDDGDLALLLQGKCTKPFFKLDKVFWTRNPKKSNEWEEEINELIQYGKGDQSNYQGSMYIKTENILYIHPLKDIATRDGKKRTG